MSIRRHKVGAEGQYGHTGCKTIFHIQYLFLYFIDKKNYPPVLPCLICISGPLLYVNAMTVHKKITRRTDDLHAHSMGSINRYQSCSLKSRRYWFKMQLVFWVVSFATRPWLLRFVQTAFVCTSLPARSLSLTYA